MAMKETEGSLRGYFLIAGGLGVLMSLREISEIRDHSISFLPVGQKAAIYISIVMRMVVGCGFVFSGLKLKSALLTGATWIKKLLVAAGAMLLINGALITAERDSAYTTGAIIGALVALAIITYLHRSVTRLAAEAAAKAGLAPPPPQAKIAR
jgi:hypothetical protein